ncbi:DUF697 domain-containing protein, partial [Klebsiella pneumoniae]
INDRIGFTAATSQDIWPEHPEKVLGTRRDWVERHPHTPPARVAARLAARAAQGIGAGLLTARLGIKAMELCRPLPWIADDKPRLGDFRRELIGQLKETLQKSKTRPEK